MTLQQTEEHFDALVVANALPSAKLVDAARADPMYTDDDVMMMGARLSAYTANFDAGPLAAVRQSPQLRDAFRRFVNISPSDRPAGRTVQDDGRGACLARRAGQAEARSGDLISASPPQRRPRPRQRCCRG